MDNSHRVTLAEVARALGLTKMSVSRALKGGRGVSEATRATVNATAQKMGYMPDPAISTAMARMRSRKRAELDTIAWLTSHGKPGAWRDNFIISEIHRGATEQAARLGYRLEEFVLNEAGMSPRRLGGILYSRAVRGVVIAPLREQGAIEGFPWQHFASVACGPSLSSPLLHRVSADQYMVVRVAWAALAERGYRRPGLFVSATDSRRVNDRWRSGLLGVQQLFSPDQVVPPMVTDDWNPEVFLRWYREHRPDVVLAYPEVCDWLRKGGVKVPRDCGFALLNYHECGRYAGVAHHFGHQGAAAVALVAADIHANQFGLPAVRKNVSMECVWRDGPTVRPLKKKRAPAKATVQ